MFLVIVIKITIIIIIIFIFTTTGAKTLFSMFAKKDQLAQIGERGEVIWGMPERKRIFLWMSALLGVKSTLTTHVNFVNLQKEFRVLNIQA